ncbi:hypothetical protein MLD38_003902 [Melastoma candidum]|uniref:Uncharacterized protein n=1 Tax=Melastoma candidum TaxID=119954 RepID=A0ACB9S4A1_9MYRT|nr:hypothetical protein MLD38_003902 [Melastoma candidum]
MVARGVEGRSAPPLFLETSLWLTWDWGLSRCKLSFCRAFGTLPFLSRHRYLTLDWSLRTLKETRWNWQIS